MGILRHVPGHSIGQVASTLPMSLLRIDRCTPGCLSPGLVLMQLPLASGLLHHSVLFRLFACVPLRMLFQEALDTYQGFFKFVVGGTVGATHKACASSAKGATGNDSYLLLKEQFLCELIVGHACACNRGKGVEGSSRLTTGQNNIIEASNKHATPTIIVIMHHAHVSLTMAQCHQRSLLGSSASTHNGILVYFEHGLQDAWRSSSIADTPACHSIRLGEPIQQDSAFAHTAQGSHTDVFGVIDKATIYLVNDEEQVMLYGKFGDAFQLIPRDHCPGRVIRIAKQNYFRTRRNRGSNLGGTHCKAVFCIGRDGYCDTTSKDNIGIVGDIARIE